VVIVCVVVGTVAGTVVFVVVVGSDIPQLLLTLAISTNNRKIRIMEVSLIARFTQ
jgi:ribose/xylose/arabinose/galactoside ABC-type transport system permease subunit